MAAALAGIFLFTSQTNNFLFSYYQSLFLCVYKVQCQVDLNKVFLKFKIMTRFCSWCQLNILLSQSRRKFYWKKISKEQIYRNRRNIKEGKKIDRENLGLFTRTLTRMTNSAKNCLLIVITLKQRTLSLKTVGPILSFMFSLKLVALMSISNLIDEKLIYNESSDFNF